METVVISLKENYHKREEEVIQKAVLLHEPSKNKLDVSLEDICALIGLGARVRNLNLKTSFGKYQHDVEYKGFNFISTSDKLLVPIITQAFGGY